MLKLTKVFINRSNEEYICTFSVEDCICDSNKNRRIMNCQKSVLWYQNLPLHPATLVAHFTWLRLTAKLLYTIKQYLVKLS